jgi:signal peptidase I
VAAVEDDDTSTGEVAVERRGRGVKLFLRDVLLILLAALLISFLIKTFLIRSFFIPSGSMESTLLEDDRIIVNQLVPDVTELERGDIVVFRDPGGWLDTVPPERSPVVEFFEGALSIVGLAAPDSDEHLIKRVIGLPGDTIACCNDFGQMSVNGVPLDEPYTQLPAGVTRVSEKNFEVTVPEGTIWVMGDNRYYSADSRAHLGDVDAASPFVPIEDVVGRAIIVTAPVSRWGWLDNHSEVFRGIDDRAADAPTLEEVSAG